MPTLLEHLWKVFFIAFLCLKLFEIKCTHINASRWTGITRNVSTIFNPNLFYRNCHKLRARVLSGHGSKVENNNYDCLYLSVKSPGATD